MTIGVFWLPMHKRSWLRISHIPLDLLVQAYAGWWRTQRRRRCTPGEEKVFYTRFSCLSCSPPKPPPSYLDHPRVRRPRIALRTATGLQCLCEGDRAWIVLVEVLLADFATEICESNVQMHHVHLHGRHPVPSVDTEGNHIATYEMDRFDVFK
jgi:hypothetical protein